MEEEDYDKKLNEIQEKYKKALNLGNNTSEVTLPKLKEKKRSAKDLPFSMDEFHTLKEKV